jgi:RRXRR protein
MQYVPVVDFAQRPLMPTTPARAESWIKSRKATPFFRKGIFCVRLNVEPSNRHTQPVAVGIDPGSQREGYTVKSKSPALAYIASTQENACVKTQSLRIVSSWLTTHGEL